MHQQPERKYQGQVEDCVVYHTCKSYVLKVLLEGQRSVLVQVLRQDCVLNGSARPRRQPLQELHDMQASERHSQRRWVVLHLDEDVNEDELAKDEEVIEGRTHTD